MPEPRVYIITGATGSGKTRSLAEWSSNRKDVAGILTPVAEGKRVFHNAGTGEIFPMEAGTGEADVITVGRFVFSQRNFDKAAQVIRDAGRTNGWLLIDEIGPLELKGEGFCNILNELLAKRRNKILLVVREGLVEKVKEAFGMKDTVVINDISKLKS